MQRIISLLLLLEMAIAFDETINEAKSNCTDVLFRFTCRSRLAAGKCDHKGCDLTCGKCNVPDGWHKTRARWFPGKEYHRLVATGDWWLSLTHAEGAYATVVVPTICKRLERLKVLVLRLSTEMQCVGEVMIVAHAPCSERVTEMLRGVNQTLLRSKKVIQTVMDMGGWDPMYGPGARFLAARSARGTTLVHLDDDELPCERQVCGVAAAAAKEPIGIYGHHKRNCNPLKGYQTSGDPRRLRSNKPFNVLLTLFAATSRAYNDIFVRHFDRYAKALASVKGNGEDIAYSHFLLKHFNKTPSYVERAPCYTYAVNNTVVETYAKGFSHMNDDTGISSNLFSHYTARRIICRRLWNDTRWEWRIKGRKEKDPVLVPRNIKTRLWTI
jgi:hypothetical protein